MSESNQSRSGSRIKIYPPPTVDPKEQIVFIKESRKTDSCYEGDASQAKYRKEYQDCTKWQQELSGFIKPADGYYLTRKLDKNAKGIIKYLTRNSGQWCYDSGRVGFKMVFEYLGGIVLRVTSFPWHQPDGRDGYETINVTGEYGFSLSSSNESKYFLIVSDDSFRYYRYDYSIPRGRTMSTDRSVLIKRCSL